MCFCNFQCPESQRENVRVIVGPRGPIGPQGPQGVPGISNAVYAGGGVQTVATDTIIPINQIAATPVSPFSVVNNSVVVPAGTYLVSYGFTGDVTAGGEVDVSLYANGVAVPNETVSSYSTATFDTTGEKTALYQVAAPTALSLINTSDGSVNFSNAHLTVSKLA